MHDLLALHQAKATSASERKRLGDDLKIERAGRQRAEELLVKQVRSRLVLAGTHMYVFVDPPVQCCRHQRCGGVGMAMMESCHCPATACISS